MGLLEMEDPAITLGAVEMFSLPEGLTPELAGSVFVLCHASRSRQEGVPALGAGMLAPT